MKVIGLSDRAEGRSVKWRVRLANLVVLVALAPCLAERQAWYEGIKWSDDRLYRIGEYLHLLGASMILLSAVGILAEWIWARKMALTAWKYGAALVLGVVGGVVVQRPNSTFTSFQNACVNNIRQIDSAKQAWAHDHGKSEYATPQASDLVPYLGHGSTGELPWCPTAVSKSFSNSYNINSVGETPTCKIVPLKHILP